MTSPGDGSAWPQDASADSSTTGSPSFTDSSTSGSPSFAGGFARWWASWRLAIRIARRDARRHLWRSALIVVMVGVPVLLLTSGITMMATNDVTLTESVPLVMGSAQARIHPEGDGHRLTQSPDALAAPVSKLDRGGASAALPVPGFAPDSAWTSWWSPHRCRRPTGTRPNAARWCACLSGDGSTTRSTRCARQALRSS